MRSIKGLLADAKKLSVTLNKVEGGLTSFCISALDADLSKEDKETLKLEVEKLFSVSYSKKINASINLLHTLELTSEQKALLYGKGFYAFYEQLREFKNGTKEIVDSIQSVKIKGVSPAQKMADKNGAENAKSETVKSDTKNHLATAQKISVADINDILESIKEMALKAVGNEAILALINSNLLALENQVYEMLK